MGANKKNGNQVKDVKDKGKVAGNADELAQRAEKRAQKVMSIVCFMFFGLLVGFLWGANHMIEMVNEPTALSQAVRVGYLVATNTADVVRGAVSGLIGAGCGGVFGAALFLKV